MKRIIITVLLIGVYMSAYSQRNEPHSERVQTAKIAYISQALKLSPKEAKIFWPIYDEYQENRKALNMQNRSRINEVRLAKAKT